jgi:proliferating cell nuclear antigen
MQAMDSSHVALVSFQLDESGFSSFRCDRQITLGNFYLFSRTQHRKPVKNTQVRRKRRHHYPPGRRRTFHCQIHFRRTKFFYLTKENERFSEFNLNLLQLDSEQLGIPDTEYSSVVTLSSAEFTKICRELSSLAETSIN